ARCLALFHASVAPDPAAAARFGGPLAITRNVEENFAQAAEAMRAYASAEAAEIVRWQTVFLRDHRALFERRIAEGRVRDGHGDLRLEHVYLERPAPTIIDCVEFADRYRVADVCADVAF